MTISYLAIRFHLLQNHCVISNVSSGAPEKNGNDVTVHLKHQPDCLAEALIRGSQVY